MKLDKPTKDNIDKYFNNISPEELLEKYLSIPTDDEIEAESMYHDAEYMAEHFFIESAKWLKENIKKPSSIVNLEYIKYNLLTNHEIFINITKRLFDEKFMIEIIYRHKLSKELMQLSLEWFYLHNIDYLYCTYDEALINSINLIKKLLKNKDLHLKNNNEKFLK